MKTYRLSRLLGELIVDNSVWEGLEVLFDPIAFSDDRSHQTTTRDMLTVGLNRLGRSARCALLVRYDDTYHGMRLVDALKVLESDGCAVLLQGASFDGSHFLGDPSDGSIIRVDSNTDGMVTKIMATRLRGVVDPVIERCDWTHGFRAKRFFSPPGPADWVEAAKHAILHRHSLVHNGMMCLLDQGGMSFSIPEREALENALMKRVETIDFPWRSIAMSGT